MKSNSFIIIMLMGLLTISCSSDEKAIPIPGTDAFYNVESFADLAILRYEVSGWEDLDLKQKTLLYYLNEAALQGRDILFDQNNRYNLAIRKTLEAIYTSYKGDKRSNDFKEFEVYLKRVWFSNGIHHHYGEDKFLPGFSTEFFIDAVKSLNKNQIPLREGQSVDEFIQEFTPVLFNPTVFAKKVNQDPNVDVIVNSANNYYSDYITQTEVEAFYNAMKDPKDPRPVPFGLNSRLIKKDSVLYEDVYKVGGLYSSAIEKIIYWLEKAIPFAENDRQKKTIELLIEYYNTGCLKKYDEYSIEWVQDMQSEIDFVNGFTETYGDALGIKASWEALVNFKNLEASKISDIISDNAQWFEDHSPINDQFKKKEVKGVSSKIITAAILGGDCYPATPIGVNLPNSDWIRKEYGSKSVTITNITEAYDRAAAGSGFNDEFIYGEYEKGLLKKYGAQTDNLHTELHECLGHGSGQLLAGISSDALKTYGATIEETRADLFGLYFIPDQKILDLGILSDPEAYKAEYYKYMMNGLMTQLSRIELGKDIEESHMRNRALIARWVYEQGRVDNVIELKKADGKTYLFINDYEKMRTLIGVLLAEIQRIKSEGDINAAATIVEKYAVKIDPELHVEILNRYRSLNIAPYKGFVNPLYEAIYDKEGVIIDVKISYTEGYAEQMLRYAKDYSPLTN
jgi:Peptidase family M49.